MADRAWPRRGRGLILTPLLVVGAALATLVLDRESGLTAMLELRGRVERAHARVAALSEERNSLLRKIQSLRSDPFAVEAAARERLGMVRPGEIVIRLGNEAGEAD
ncbi:MAG: septum formation initiator family protein [Myxococcota bacterium]